MAVRHGASTTETEIGAHHLTGWDAAGLDLPRAAERFLAQLQDR